MLRPTFSNAINSGIPRALGLLPTDRATLAGYINSAEERLITDPLAPDEGWWGGWVTMLFNLSVTNHTATVRTPHDIARIIVLDICKRPRFIRNGFYEYLQFGTGHQPQGCKGGSCCDTQQAFDRDNVATLIDFPTSAPQAVRLYPTNSADVGRRVLLQGTDQNGLVVRGVDVNGAPMLGEMVTLVLPFAQSVNQFQDITGILKDPTLGPVTFFTIDPVTGAQTELSAMDPNETTAAYREYFFNGLPAHCCNTPNNQVQVFAQAKLDFVPVVADTDYLCIPNIPALEEECQSIRYSRFDSPQAPALESKHHAKAISLLNGQLDLYLGKVRTAISVSIFGSERLRVGPI